MAKEIANKKRKASVPDSEPVIVKKVKQVTTETLVLPEKKRKAAEDVSPAATKKSKNKALDGTTSETTITKKAGKKDAKPQESVDESVSAAASVKKTTKPKTSKKSATEDKPHILVDEKAMSEDGNDETDDQTEALLKGFESDDDEDVVVNNGASFKEGDSVGKAPDISKALSKKAKKSQSEESDKPGVIYIGRIPHGFYENEMREYFKQFGTINKLRMSRNPKTGSSKHFAFVEFESATVAEIVAKTMDNYLLFNHILKVKLVADEQVHEKLFVGANKRFKKVPWGKIRGRELEQGASEEVWEGRISKENKRRAAKADKLKAIGYEFEAPKLKSAKGVSVQFSEKVKEVGVQSHITEPVAEVASITPVLPSPAEAKANAVETAKVAKELATGEAKQDGKKAVKNAKTPKSAAPDVAVESSSTTTPVIVDSKKGKKKAGKVVEAEISESVASAPVVAVVAVVGEQNSGKKGAKKVAEAVAETIATQVAPVVAAEDDNAKKTRGRKAKAVEPEVVAEAEPSKKRGRKAKSGDDIKVNTAEAPVAEESSKPKKKAKKA